MFLLTSIVVGGIERGDNSMKKLFEMFKKKKKTITPMPEWNKLVEMLYDRNLDFTDLTVEKVIYSKDKSKRYVVLKNDKGFFTYHFEKIYQYDEEEWYYLGSPDSMPGYWQEANNGSKSVFSSRQDAVKGLEQEHEYKLFWS